MVKPVLTELDDFTNHNSHNWEKKQSRQLVQHSIPTSCLLVLLPSNNCDVWMSSTQAIYHIVVSPSTCHLQTLWSHWNKCMKTFNISNGWNLFSSFFAPLSQFPAGVSGTSAERTRGHSINDLTNTIERQLQTITARFLLPEWTLNGNTRLDVHSVWR